MTRVKQFGLDVDVEFTAGSPFPISYTDSDSTLVFTSPTVTLKTAGGDVMTGTPVPAVAVAGNVLTCEWDTAASAAMNTTTGKRGLTYTFEVQALVDGEGPYPIFAGSAVVWPKGIASTSGASSYSATGTITLGGAAISGTILIGNAAASRIAITDAGGYFTSVDVEGALQEAGNVLALGTTVIAPGGTSDDTAAVAAAALEAAGGRLVFKAGVTYTLAYGYLTGLVLIPNDTVVEVQHGATIIGKSNTATGTDVYRLFGFANESAPENIHFVGRGLIDGNRRGGNGGSTENCGAIFGSNAVDFSVSGGLTFTNFRSEAVYIGHSIGGVLPQRCHIDNIIVTDCGYPAPAATNTTTRMGVAFTGGKDLSVTNSVFDTIKGYAIDFEGNRSGDVFDNVHTSGNQFRACEQGFVNVTSPDTCSNIDVRDWKANGLHTTTNTFVIPSATRSVQILNRTAGDLTLTPGNTSWNDLGTISDLVLEGCHPGDVVEVSLSSAWDNAGTFRNLDVASIVSSSPVNYWGTNDSTPVNGVHAWRGTSGTARPFGGSVCRRLTTTDLDSNGKLTLRFRYKLNAATTTVLTASAPALQAFAKNHGPY